MDKDNKLSTEVNSKNIDPISFFDEDSNFVFVYKKTEKLASAIYMITNLFAESEPMKWTLRKKISELVSFALTYKDIHESSKRDFLHSTNTRVLEIVSFLEISQHGGLISQMNFSILKQEFSNITLELQDTDSNREGNNPIPKNFFALHEPKFAAPQQVISSTPNYPRIESITPAFKKPTVEPTKDVSQEFPTRISKDEMKKNNRQEVILGLLRKKKDLTIKDMAEFIKNCSEKTIQRELNTLILKGTLKRTGVRRWSKYSLA